jgi:HEAT repeat protein
MLLVLASFSTIVLFRFVKLVWAQGIAETAWNVGFNAIPGARRDQARAFLNAIPGQAGVVISGVLLVIGEQALSPGQMAWIGFISALLCLLVIWQARRAYKLALVDALRSGQLQVFSEEEQPFGGFRNDATALPVALTGLEDPHPGVRRLSAEILQQLASPQAVTALQRAAGDPDFEVRLAALKALAAYDPSQAVSVSIQALQDPQPEVRCQAIQILSVQKDGPELYLEPIRMAGEDSEPAVRAHVALALTRFGEVDPAYTLLAGLANDPRPETRVEALRLLGQCWTALPTPDPRWIRIVQSGLEDEIAAVRTTAADSLPVPPGELVEALVHNLGDDDRAARQAAAQALGRVGSSAQPAVLDALHRPELESGALLALECLPGPPPVETLRTYAAQNVARAVRYYNLANSLSANGHQPGGGALSGTTVEGSLAEGERRRLLSESLLAMARLRALNALKGLGLVTDRRSVDLSIESLDSPDRSQRAYAVETLDSLGEPQLVRPLIPIWEGSPASPIPLNGQWTEILHDPDPWLRACAVIFARDHPDDRVNRMLEDLARSDPDELVRSTAVWALLGEQPMDTLQTVPTMERVLFLKRVRLFANLSPGDLKQIAATLEERLYTDGETIVELGDPGDEMYIITSGEVSVLGDGGRELARRKAGDIVGEMAIISQQPRMATMVAQGEVRALCIAQKQFEGILRERFEISMAVMRELCTRLRQAQASR